MWFSALFLLITIKTTVTHITTAVTYLTALNVARLTYLEIAVNIAVAEHSAPSALMITLSSSEVAKSTKPFSNTKQLIPLNSPVLSIIPLNLSPKLIFSQIRFMLLLLLVLNPIIFLKIQV